MSVCPAGTSNRIISGNNICCGRIITTPQFTNFDFYYPGSAAFSDIARCLISEWTPTDKQLSRIEFYKTLYSFRQANYNLPNGNCRENENAYFFQSTREQVGIPTGGGVCIPSELNLFETSIGAYPLLWYRHLDNRQIEYIPDHNLYPRKNFGVPSPQDCGTCPSGTVCDIIQERCVSTQTLETLETLETSQEQQKPKRHVGFGLGLGLGIGITVVIILLVIYVCFI